MSSTDATVQDVASLDEFLNTTATEPVLEVAYLEFEFRPEYDVFAPASGGTRVHQPPDHVVVALSLRLEVTTTNYERGDDSGREKLKRRVGFHDALS